MLDFIQQLVSGIALGCVYGLIALGFVLIYKATEVVNFAQGDQRTSATQKCTRGKAAPDWGQSFTTRPIAVWSRP